MKCSGKHYTTYSAFSPLRFMLYRGKSISFGRVHCLKSNKNFLNITWNLVENIILLVHEIFRVVPRFPRYISCYIAEIWIAFLTVHDCIVAAGLPFFPFLRTYIAILTPPFELFAAVSAHTSGKNKQSNSLKTCQLRTKPKPYAGTNVRF